MSGVRKNFGKQFNLSSGVLDLIMKSWLEGTKVDYNHLMQMYQVVLNFWLSISENLVVSILQSTQLVQLCHLFS